MKSIVVWSDLHAHLWQQHERPDRYKDFVHAIDVIFKYATDDPSCVCVVFNGDLFESKQGHSSLVWSAVVESLTYNIQKFVDVSPHNRMVAFNTGNHDIYRKRSVLRAFQSLPRCFVAYNRPSRLVIEVALHSNAAPRRVDCVLIPYDCGYVSKEQMQNDVPHGVYDYAFTHANIAGLVHEHNIVDKTSTLDASWFSHAHTIINGHIHVQQQLRVNDVPVYTVGPPIQIGWGDLGDLTRFNRGVLRIELSGLCHNHDKITRVVLPGLSALPAFYDASSKALRGAHVATSNDFVRAKIEDIEEQEQQTASKETRERRAFIQMRGETMIREYVKRAGANMLHVDELIECGKRLLIGRD